MMIHPVIEELRKLRLQGLAEALEMQLRSPGEAKNLLFEERLALLVDHEKVLRDRKRLQKRLQQAKFKQQACMQDITYESCRKLDKSLLLSFESCRWITDHRNILITGATGTGKSYLAEALTQNACLKGFTARRVQFPRFFHEMHAAKADGTYLKLQTELLKIDVLLIDDFAIAPCTDENRRDLLEIMDDRYNKKSTVVTSQLPVQEWHDAIGDKTLADAILDRLVHNAYRIALEGESMRKKTKPKNEEL
jgi:DNA replication protein DnaC